MKRRILPLAVVLVTACGGAEEDEPTTPELPYQDLEPAEPLDYDAVEIGVGLHHGEALAIAYGGTPSYEKAAATIDHAFMWVQAFDEGAATFGEYLVYPAPSEVTDARSASDFIGTNSANARFEARADDFAAELEAAAEEGGASFGKKSIVMDLFRLRGDWWVRWDGNLDDEVNRVGKGPYGLNRDDMYEDLLDQIEAVAAAQKPDYFIIGDEMERLLADTDSEGLSTAEFSNFHAFFQEAVSRIHEQSSATKVGVGFNWDRFVAEVAPMYATGAEISHLQVMDRAFAAVILPFVEVGDIVALQSYRDVDDLEVPFPVNNLPVDETYQFLRRVDGLYELNGEKPIVFYSVGTPVDSPVAYLRQRNYLEDFAVWTAGVNPEVVAWRTLVNIDGTDTSTQEVSGRCRSLTETTRDFQLPISACYDGLFTSVYSAKDPFDLLSGED